METPKMNHYPMAQSSVTPYPVSHEVHHYPIQHAQSTFAYSLGQEPIKHWLGYEPDFVKLEKPQIPVLEPISYAPPVVQMHDQPKAEEKVEVKEVVKEPTKPYSEPKEVKREKAKEKVKDVPKRKSEPQESTHKPKKTKKTEIKTVKVKDEYASLKKVGVTISPKAPKPIYDKSANNVSHSETESHIDQMNGFDSAGFK